MTIEMNKGLTIPFEVADGITLAVLEEQYTYLNQELKDHKQNGKWMHPEDVVNSEQNLIPALKILIKHFGGSV
jgi:hypothetical protein